ncbi:MAG: UDP-glucose 4-epimerase GalE [Deltaproteobacteria bacterium]|nr:MAG: UDP-glucose 4-epimerase GalE [Deltaproteobacteria bacterium]RLC18684.1 MAG: UDP-glucose 4-epimerase GalE [Deltaproteobacteria bacterium]
MKILVTGGAGYIGSHTCIELLNENYDVVVLDNLSNSSEESLKRVKSITGKHLEFYKADLLDKEQVTAIFLNHKIDAVIHFAGLKAVGESVTIPLKYFHNNITGTLNLLEVMNDFNVKNIVFSSSATVYGDPSSLPIKENFPLSATNPYGRTKLMIEEILQDIYRSDKNWNIALLRYFNPVGAHESGKIGEDPFGIPNNLVPYISQVAVGVLPRVSVYGDDYDTPDGTGVRDYIHVVDLALGHIKTLPKLFTSPGVVIYNLGTGFGYSVLEMIKGFEAASDKKIPYKVCERRPGDIAACWADPVKAKEELFWEADKTLIDMCRDTWKWQKNNPNGYRES